MDQIETMCNLIIRQNPKFEWVFLHVTPHIVSKHRQYNSEVLVVEKWLRTLYMAISGGILQLKKTETSPPLNFSIFDRNSFRGIDHILRENLIDLIVIQNSQNYGQSFH